MTFSYTQISQYLTCPRKYRYRYLDGWQEKDTRAAMLFGRAFEAALAAYFRRQDANEIFFREWASYRNLPLEYPNGNSWDRLLRQGRQLLERFAQEDRIRVHQPRRNQQVKYTRRLPSGHEFVAFIDAIGQLDGTECLLEWKTSANSYPEAPEGIVALDPQLLCYSWMTGISDCALVVFVRKRLVEIQYLRTTISGAQRSAFADTVEASIRLIEGGHFPQHSGIRFPQNPCTSCAFVGLCLSKQELVNTALLRRPGGDLGWLDELGY